MLEYISIEDLSFLVKIYKIRCMYKKFKTDESTILLIEDEKIRTEELSKLRFKILKKSLYMSISYTLLQIIFPTFIQSNNSCPMLFFSSWAVLFLHCLYIYYPTFLIAKFILACLVEKHRSNFIVSILFYHINS